MDIKMPKYSTYFFTYFLVIFLMSGCALKQPKISQSATILLKTPTMKFYDKGFISKYHDYIQVQIFSAGNLVLNLDIYEDRICKSTFECQSLKEFNQQNLDASYEESFIKKLFENRDKKVVFRDEKRGILIKIIRD